MPRDAEMPNAFYEVVFMYFEKAVSISHIFIFDELLGFFRAKTDYCEQILIYESFQYPHLR